MKMYFTINLMAVVITYHKSYYIFVYTCSILKKRREAVWTDTFRRSNEVRTYHVPLYVEASPLM